MDARPRTKALQFQLKFAFVAIALCASLLGWFSDRSHIQQAKVQLRTDLAKQSESCAQLSASLKESEKSIAVLESELSLWQSLFRTFWSLDPNRAEHREYYREMKELTVQLPHAWSESPVIVDGWHGNVAVFHAYAMASTDTTTSVVVLIGKEGLLDFLCIKSGRREGHRPPALEDLNGDAVPELVVRTNLMTEDGGSNRDVYAITKRGFQKMEQVQSGMQTDPTP